MADCTCSVLPEKYHYVYYGITEPGSMWEWNPDCPEHPPYQEPGALSAEDIERIDASLAACCDSHARTGWCENDPEDEWL